MKERGNDSKVMDIRIFDPADAEARKTNVNSFDVLTSNPNMIIGEGWIDQANKKTDISVKVKYEKARLSSEAEILQQIESLTKPGSSVFFFMAAGSGSGGPLGRGAAIIRINDNKDPKSRKKYLISNVNIVDGKPFGEETPIFESDKIKEVTKWVVDGHKPRFC